MNYTEAQEYLNSRLKFGIKFGLDRIKALAEAFDNPQNKIRTIHVGGTNGKGSTATFISSILHEAGYKTGTYLSPYVFDMRERIQIDGNMISEDDFASILSDIKPVADKIGETELGPVTEFELKTMAAFLYFARKNVDFAVLEVGMGGRFDSTNIVHPLVSVITNVSLDHMERLGNTVEKIAFEKAGIIKKDVTLVTASDNDEALSVIAKRCKEENAKLWRVVDSEADKPSEVDIDVKLEYKSDGAKFSFCGVGRKIPSLSPGLAGDFQHINAATAAAAIFALEKHGIFISSETISDGIANAYIPGRLEILQYRPTLIIDGAHNPDAARQLAKSISADFVYGKMILVIGMITTHAPDGVLAYLGPMAHTIIATQSKWFKASNAEEIAAVARKHCHNVEIVDNVPGAIEQALKLADKNDMVLVTGSFYTIGEADKFKKLTAKKVKSHSMANL